MENSYRLKVKVGVHEFEAEGERKDVQAQFDSWKELIALAPPTAMPYPQDNPLPTQVQTPAVPPVAEMASLDSKLDKITKTDNRTISLTIRPESTADAILLILYGQKVLRSNDAVTGSEVMDGLTSTGGVTVSRVDRLLEKAAADGDVIVTGIRRTKRYRLTNIGLQKARTLAEKWLAIVA